MKVVIPVAGKGTRLKPYTDIISKVLIPVAGKQILGHILESFVSLKVKEVIFIVGDFEKEIIKYVKNNFHFKITTIKQEQPLGLGHAIYLACKYIKKEEPIFIILGDTIIETNLEKVIKNKYSSIGIKKVSNPSNFGVVETNGKFIVDLVEKPKEPKSNLAICGAYFITNPNLLYNCLQEIINDNKKTKNEYQITDALKLMVNKGEKLTTFFINNWYDCGTIENLLHTNKKLLTKFNFKYKKENCIIIPPVFIADKAKVKNSIIGPYVSISNGAKIINSIVKNTIISNIEIRDKVLNGSLIIDHNSNL